MLILLLMGVMSATWMVDGVVLALIYYGVRILSRKAVWRGRGSVLMLTVINHQGHCLSENFSYLCKVLGQVSNNILVTKQLESIRYIR